MLIIFIYIFYAYITTKNPILDYFYLFAVYSVLLQWTFLNGECIIPYYYKKTNNPNYIAGQQLFDTDYNESFDYKTGQIIGILMNIIVCIGLYIVAKRNNISLYLIVPLLIIYEIYIYSLYIVSDTSQHKTFHLVQDFVKYSVITILLVGILLGRSL